MNNHCSNSKSIIGMGSPIPETRNADLSSIVVTTEVMQTLDINYIKITHNGSLPQMGMCLLRSRLRLTGDWQHVNHVNVRVQQYIL